MPTATLEKCACPACKCEVDTSTAIEKDGKFYCSQPCAEGHVNGGTCAQPDCGCHQ